MREPRHLVLIAHGSRRAASNDEIRAFTGRVSTALTDHFERVSCAFLELAEPRISKAIDAAVQEGAGRIELFPYFLAAGRHVAEDIPALVAAKRSEHPRVTLVLHEHLGAWEGFAEVIAAGLRR